MQLLPKRAVLFSLFPIIRGMFLFSLRAEVSDPLLKLFRELNRGKVASAKETLGAHSCKAETASAKRCSSQPWSHVALR